MVIGPFINASTILFGGVLGTLLSQHLPERIRASIASIFGPCSLGIGILPVTKCANLSVMVLVTLVGALTGEFRYLEKGINTTITRAQQLFTRSDANTTHEFFIQSYVAIIVLFRANGIGIFGAIYKGMTGDLNILIVRSFSNFLATIIFTCSLGIAVSAICVPMLAIQLALATCAMLILPLTTPAIMADFSAIGGLLLLVTGLRICGIETFAVASVPPVLLLAMLLSTAQTTFSA